MAKAQKSFESRFRKQVSRITATGQDLKPKEVERRAKAQAIRHHAAAQQRSSKNPNIRAQASEARTSPRSPKLQKSRGKALRTARTSAGTNLRTGAAQSALKTGRKAIKASVRKGTVGRKRGSRALAQIAKMDPTTRRALIASSGGRTTRGETAFKGGLKNRQGQDLNLLLKGAKKKAKKSRTTTKQQQRLLDATKAAKKKAKKPKTATPSRDSRTGAR
jgi:hypothetical protein